MKGVVITSYYFYPENTPRAFRTLELAKYFAGKGYDVKVVIPNYGVEYRNIEAMYNIEVVQTKGRFGNKVQQLENSKPSLIARFTTLKIILRYFLGSKDLFFCFPLYSTLKLINRKNLITDYSFIAVGLPVSVTIGTSLFLGKFSIDREKAIAEYGDPYYYNPAIKRFIIHKYIERFALRNYQHITIPTSNVISCYTYFKKETEIKVIPQGFNLEDVKISEYSRHNVPTFIYTGSFYENQKETTVEFMRFLVSLSIDFKFIIYSDVTMRIGDGIKTLYPFLEPLKNKIILNDLVPRDQCLLEISKADFLIYIDADVVIPSKLIDYKISNRPVLHVDKSKKYQKWFKEFIRGNYENNYARGVDLNEFDIKNVGEKFENLIL